MFFYLNFSFLSVSVWKDFVWHSYLSNNSHLKKNGCSRIYVYFPSLSFYFPYPSFPTYYHRIYFIDYDFMLSFHAFFHLTNATKNRKFFSFFLLYSLLFRFITSDFTHFPYSSAKCCVISQLPASSKKDTSYKLPFICLQ